MNIQLLTPKIFLFPPQKQNSYNKNYAAYPNLAGLKQDTVSFSGKLPKVIEAEELIEDSSKAKKLKQMTKEVSARLCQKVAKDSQQPLKEFLRVLRQGLKNLISCEAHPDNPILSIKGRVKTPRSIAQKAVSRKRYSQKEIDTMGDVIGTRIVMRSTSKKDFDMLFSGLGKLVKRGELKVKEIENYRPLPKDSYVSTSTLNKFEKLCNDVGLYPLRKEQAIPSGYTAVHLTVELPSGKLAEIQIMGRDMENVKEIEDFYYKYNCGKPLDPKYKSIYELMDRLIPKLDSFQNQTLDRYIRDSYARARTIEPRSLKYRGNVIKDFLPFPYYLPQELSFQNLYQMKEQCDRLAKSTVSSQK